MDHLLFRTQHFMINSSFIVLYLAWVVQYNDLIIRSQIINDHIWPVHPCVKTPPHMLWICFNYLYTHLINLVISNDHHRMSTNDIINIINRPTAIWLTELYY